VQLADPSDTDAADEHQSTAEEQPRATDPVVEEAVRRRAHELAQAHPHATAEENWLRAEAELRADPSRRDRDAEARAAEEEATLRAKIAMNVYGHP
jgi:ATP-dependent helicase YprA (DUF1998 family)